MGVVFVCCADQQVLPPSHDLSEDFAFELFCEGVCVVVGAEFDPHLPGRDAGRSRLGCLLCFQACVLRLFRRGRSRKRHARVFPAFFEVVPAVELELAADMLRGEQVLDDLFRLPRRSLRVCVEEDAAAVAADRDPVAVA